MASRKSRKVNKRFSKVNKEWPEKDATNANKSSTRKKKLLDLLGSQWSKEELERFYESYRKYGKDWKKVAGTLRSRSIEMMEALYNMNRAYLSLPEGTATAAGLIAMMTDHYNNQEGSDSERESNDVTRTSRKTQKRGRGKIRLAPKGTDGNDPDLLQNQSSPSSYGGLSLLKRNLSRDLFAGRGPRAVGRRTPRIPVSNMSGRDKTISPIKQGLKFPANAVDDDGAHVAAWALAEASQRGGSPQVSRTPDGKGKSLEPTIAKFIDVRIDDDCLEGSLESREAENGDVARDVESAGAIESHRRMKKGRGKRPKPGGIENDHFDDDRGECSGTEEGITRRKIKDEIDMEVTDAKAIRVCKGSRKRSRQLFFGDESSALVALQTLADLSVNILLPASTIESESSVHVKEEQKNADTDEKPGIPESMSTNHTRDKSVIFEKKDRGGHTTIFGAEVVTRRNSKPAKVITHDKNASSEIKPQTCKSIPKVQKRKQKLLNEKTPKAEYSNDAQNSEFQKTEVLVEDGKGFISKVKIRSQVTQLPKQGKLIKPPERPSDTDLGNTRTDLTEAIVQRSTEDQVVLPTKICNRRKMDLQKALSSKDLKTNHGAGLCSFINKDKLCHCLSSPMLRRWCVFEWFYSAIDYPWFARSEFVEYLNHVRLGHVPRLTRVEWGVIRSSLGKPRRFSEKFLQEEREKLEQYRELVRTHYAELRAGVREGLPTDLARPLSVGQRVIACHAKTREVHDGSVLAVDRNRCRVQFDRPELGVEFVMDIDCMPLNPLENMPEALRRQNDAFNKFCNGFTETKLDHQSKEWNIGVSLKFAPSENFNIADGISHIALSSPMNTLMKQAKGDTIDAIMQAKAAINEVAVATQQAMYTQPCTLAQIQAREVDIRALTELALALDKKEALLIELRHMNEEVSETQEGDPVKDLEHFRKQYAMLLLQLRDANDQVASALHYLRQRNTYHGNSTSTLLRPFDNSGGTPGPLNLSNPTVFLNKDYGSHIVEVIDSSRRKARTLVDTAVKAMCTLKENDDVFFKIGEALDSANVWNSLSGHGSSAYQDHTSRRFEPTTVNALSPKPHISCDVNEVQLPLELISSCVATLYMIESCSERQYPPAEVAQILDSAVASLQPCCPQNLPIYREIETCMGIIKNQMLALIPTPTAVLPVEAPIL